MKIATRRFAEIEVKEESILTFPEGLMGFETLHRYALINRPDEEPFLWLQSLEDPNTAFVLVSPFYFMPAYDFEVDDATIGLIGLKDPKDLDLYAIVTVHPDYTRMTANLLAPVVVNKASRQARQLVLPEAAYTTRQPVFQPAS